MMVSEHQGFLHALKQGDFEELRKLWLSNPLSGSQMETLSDSIRSAADCVVAHRPHYHETLKLAAELGFPLDIWTASRAGLLDTVKSLVERERALVNRPDRFGRTPLQRAALVYGVCKECEAVVDYLLTLEAKMDIFSASTLANETAVRTQLSKDPAVVTARCQGAAPLNWAVRPRRNLTSSPIICRMLIDAGADIGDADEDESGMTPLHHAAEWGPSVCIELVDLLIDAGCDVWAKDQNGWTALDYAKDRGRSQMVTHLMRHM